MHRLFLAIWPSQAAHQKLAGLVDSTDWPSTTRLVSPESWHVTLHFIGNVPVTRLAEVAEGLVVPFDPFSITLKQEVSWGHLTVLEPDSVTVPLADLHRKLAAALQRLYLPVERRPFRPHLTLARERGGEAQPKQCVASEEKIVTPIRWQVNEYALVESAPGGRSAYTSLRHYPARNPNARK